MRTLAATVTLLVGLASYGTVSVRAQFNPFGGDENVVEPATSHPVVAQAPAASFYTVDTPQHQPVHMVRP